MTTLAAAVKLLVALAAAWGGLVALFVATARDNDPGISIAGLALIWSGVWLIRQQGWDR